MPLKKRRQSASADEDVEMKGAPNSSPVPAVAEDSGYVSAHLHACVVSEPYRAPSYLQKSESEMSVLIDDEPPKRAKKGKERAKKGKVGLRALSDSIRAQRLPRRTQMGER